MGVASAAASCHGKKTSRCILSVEAVPGRSTAKRTFTMSSKRFNMSLPPPQDNRQTLSELLSQRKTPLVAAGLAAMVLGGYISMLLVSALNGPRDDGSEILTDSEDCVPTGRPLDVRQGRMAAMVFDQELNTSEGRIGIKSLRKKISALSRGHVLEVAVGTGRNVQFIDWDEIRTTAPVVTSDGAADGLGREVLSERELQITRVKRRLEKGKKGVVLPGDEVPEVLSYTGVDVSTDMLEVAWQKLKKAVPELVPKRRRSTPEEQEQKVATATATQPQTKPSNPTTAIVANPQPNTPDQVLAANIGHGRIRLYKADATQTLPPPPALTSHDGTRTQAAPPHYDTILQNFGLCSVGSPQRLLATMAAALRPHSGRIYLLEHGRSGSHAWLDGLLDRFAPSHFRRYGCWWNRDIEALVRQAERDVPGLEVVRIERPLPWRQGGTLLLVELRVNPDKKRD